MGFLHEAISQMWIRDFNEKHARRDLQRNAESYVKQRGELRSSNSESGGDEHWKNQIIWKPRVTEAL